MAGAPALTSFTIDLPDQSAALALAGEAEINLHRLEALTGASVVMRGLALSLRGLPPQLERAAGVVELLRPLWQEGQAVSSGDLQTVLAALDTGQAAAQQQLAKQVLVRSQGGRLLRPRTPKQQAYVEAIENHDLTLALGPAGSGKTFLAAVQAVKMLQERKVERLILTRPAVEAGERLGFLPGDLQQKVDPYLRPLYDALHALLGQERTANLLDRNVIEVAPLAYMRGRTLSDAFVILDEAQNTTPTQCAWCLPAWGRTHAWSSPATPARSTCPPISAVA